LSLFVLITYKIKKPCPEGMVSSYMLVD